MKETQRACRNLLLVNNPIFICINAFRRLIERFVNDGSGRTKSSTWRPSILDEGVAQVKQKHLRMKQEGSQQISDTGAWHHLWHHLYYYSKTFKVEGIWTSPIASSEPCKQVSSPPWAFWLPVDEERWGEVWTSGLEWTKIIYVAPLFKTADQSFLGLVQPSWRAQESNGRRGVHALSPSTLLKSVQYVCLLSAWRAVACLSRPSLLHRQKLEGTLLYCCIMQQSNRQKGQFLRLWKILYTSTYQMQTLSIF